MKLATRLWMLTAGTHFAVAACLLVASARAVFRSAVAFPLVFGIIWCLLGLAAALASLKWARRGPVALLLVLGSILAMLSPVAQSLTLSRAAHRAESSALAHLRSGPGPELVHEFRFNSSGFASTGAIASASLTVLNFWGTWCGPCREEMPKLERLYRQHDREALLVVGFTRLPGGTEDAELDAALDEMRRFCSELGVTYPIWIERDSKVHEAYRVSSFPTTVLLDREGQVLDYGIGLDGAERIVRDVDDRLAMTAR